MYSGSGTGIGIGPGSNIKNDTKVKNQKRPTFWETMLLLALKRQDCVEIFGCLKTVLNKSESGTKPATNRSRNGNQKFSKVGTGTAIYY
jgi:hypothetical protein